MALLYHIGLLIHHHGLLLMGQCCIITVHFTVMGYPCVATGYCYIDTSYYEGAFVKCFKILHLFYISVFGGIPGNTLVNQGVAWYASLYSMFKKFYFNLIFVCVKFLWCMIVLGILYDYGLLLNQQGILHHYKGYCYTATGYCCITVGQCITTGQSITMGQCITTGYSCITMGCCCVTAA